MVSDIDVACSDDGCGASRHGNSFVSGGEIDPKREQGSGFVSGGGIDPKREQGNGFVSGGGINPKREQFSKIEGHRLFRRNRGHNEDRNREEPTPAANNEKGQKKRGASLLTIKQAECKTLKKYSPSVKILLTLREINEGSGSFIYSSLMFML